MMNHQVCHVVVLCIALPAGVPCLERANAIALALNTL
jgi:hypothetical protein